MLFFLWLGMAMHLQAPHPVIKYSPYSLLPLTYPILNRLKFILETQIKLRTLQRD